MSSGSGGSGNSFEEVFAGSVAVAVDIDLTAAVDFDKVLNRERTSAVAMTLADCMDQ